MGKVQPPLIPDISFIVCHHPCPWFHLIAPPPPLNTQDGAQLGKKGRYSYIWKHNLLTCEVKGGAEQNGSRGQKRATNTPHTHHLILGTENLIGWRSEEGQSAARARGYCLPRKQVKRTRDSEAKVMKCKRYLVFI